MQTPQEISEDSANVALLLDKEITKRVANAMLELFSGGALSGIAAPEYNDGSIDVDATQRILSEAVINTIRFDIQTLIRQEIIDAFGGDSGRVVNVGEQINLKIGH